MRRPVLPTSASALFYTKVCFAYLSYAKLLVCCADSLFGLDVRRRCVVLSSLQVPPHFFTQKSALSTSGIRNVSMTFFFLAYLRVTGLLTTNEQLVSSKKVLPNIAMRTSGIRNVAMTFVFGFFGHVLGLTGRRLSLRLDPTVREFPSPLVTVFDVPVARMRASGMRGN